MRTFEDFRMTQTKELQVVLVKGDRNDEEFAGGLFDRVTMRFCLPPTSQEKQVTLNHPSNRPQI